MITNEEAALYDKFFGYAGDAHRPYHNVVEEMISDMQNHRQDEEFYREDHGNLIFQAAPLLRWVAALHPWATYAEFRDAAEACGYRRNSAGNRYREARAETLEDEAHLWVQVKDGRLVPVA